MVGPRTIKLTLSHFASRLSTCCVTSGISDASIAPAHIDHSAIFVVALSSGTVSAMEPVGLWLAEGKDAVFSVARCGNALCGRIVWVKRPRDSRGAPRVDHNNPDPAKQTRPICGLTIISNLRPYGDRKWDGSIYNPRDGQTYNGDVTLVSPDSLKVRAFSAFRLFSRSQTWTRFRGSAGRLEGECRDGKGGLLPREDGEQAS